MFGGGGRGGPELSVEIGCFQVGQIPQETAKIGARPPTWVLFPPMSCPRENSVVANLGGASCPKISKWPTSDLHPWRILAASQRRLSLFCLSFFSSGPLQHKRACHKGPICSTPPSKRRYNHHKSCWSSWWLPFKPTSKKGTLKTNTKPHGWRRGWKVPNSPSRNGYALAET